MVIVLKSDTDFVMVIAFENVYCFEIVTEFVMVIFCSSCVVLIVCF
jgi:hypothetical protein